MQFFLPRLLIFVIAILVTMFLAPRVTPWMAAILALAFLVYGVHEHYSMFAYEYKQSTWQEGLKIYAPFVMVGGIIVFSMLGMVSFFAAPEHSDASISSVTNSIGNSFSGMTNSLSSVTNSLSGAANSLSGAANSLSVRANNMVQSVNRSLNKGTFSLAEAI